MQMVQRVQVVLLVMMMVQRLCCSGNRGGRSSWTETAVVAAAAEGERRQSGQMQGGLRFDEEILQASDNLVLFVLDAAMIGWRKRCRRRGDGRLQVRV